MDAMPVAGTIVSFDRVVSDANGKAYDVLGMSGYVTMPNHTPGTMRVCVKSGVYFTVALADAKAP